MQVNEINAAMVRRGLSKQEVAKSLGISITAFRRKLNGITEFKRNEIIALQDVLNLTDDEICRYFFANKVP